MWRLLIWSITFVFFAGTRHTASLQARIVYGDLVSGEITHEKPADTYFFRGSAGDVIVVEMLSVDRSLDNPLAEPVLILRDLADETLVNTVEVFPVDDTILAAELPTDGDYQITATRDENVERLATGEYTLELILVPNLTADPTPSEAISNDDVAHYYAVSSDTAFQIEYIRTEGEFAPQITVSRIVQARDGRRPVAAAYGSELDSAVLGQFAPDTTYLVEIHQNPFDYYFDVVEAIYSLRVSSR